VTLNLQRQTFQKEKCRKEQEGDKLTKGKRNLKKHPGNSSVYISRKIVGALGGKKVGSQRHLKEPTGATDRVSGNQISEDRSSKRNRWGASRGKNSGNKKGDTKPRP